MTLARTARLSPALFRFLEELRENNNREWFQANRQRYVSDVQEPLLDFVAAFASPLSSISSQFVADPSPRGGSLFRIHRDTRFSKDKTPFKTNVGVQFRHAAGKDAHTPGFYLHLEPGQVFAASGSWHPDSTALGQIRDAIVAQPARWSEICTSSSFAGGCSLWGEKLKRPPQGYDPTHPLIEHLKRKDFVAITEFTELQVCDSDFCDRFAEFCQNTAPFARFLVDALRLRW